MKAYVLNEAGGVENLVLSEIEKPKVQSDEVLVETKAISINPVDVKVRQMEEVLKMIVGEETPVTLGWDVAGVVAAVGEGVPDSPSETGCSAWSTSQGKARPTQNTWCLLQTTLPKFRHAFPSRMRPRRP